MISKGGVEVKGAAALSISSKPILATPETTNHEKSVPLCQPLRRTSKIVAARTILALLLNPCNLLSKSTDLTDTGT